MPLTETQIKALKPGEKARKVADEKGLYLLVQPSGGKLWRLKYRVDGKEKLLALGAYPDVSLKMARERRDEARRLLADGIDPSEHRKAHKAAREEAQGNSFEAIGARQASCHPSHAAKGCLFVLPIAMATTDSRSGLSVTGPAGDQFRVWRDQRAGWRSRASTYSA